MAHLWVRNDDAWVAVPLEGQVVGLTGDHTHPLCTRDADAGGAVAILRRHARHEDNWSLIAGRDPGVRVNGEALRLGVRVLADRDAIQTGAGDHYFFSTEHRPRVEAYTGGGSAAICPRCKQEIAAGSSVVRCPACGVAHHQTAELPCWTGYEGQPFATCAVDGYRATLGADFAWTPADL